MSTFAVDLELSEVHLPGVRCIQMLVPVIKFEIYNTFTKTIEEFVIENTIENQEKVFTHKKTREIRFDRQFDFQELVYPREFIELDTWAEIINSDPELFALVAEIAGV